MVLFLTALRICIPVRFILSLKTKVTNELFLISIQMSCNSWSSSVSVIVTTEKLSSYISQFWEMFSYPKTLCINKYLHLICFD